MTDRRYTSLETTNPSQTLSLVETPAKDTDSASKEGETTYQSTWTIWHGYYREYPELAAAIDKMALWTVGKGFKAEKSVEERMNKIKGFGKDNFNAIMENMIRVYLVNGDSFAEIIKDRRGRIINLKPLNPGSIKIVAGPNGLIKRYEQVDKGANKDVIAKFEPDEMFHLSFNRIADEIHGISIIESLQDSLKFVKQLDQDMLAVFHRYVMPFLKWEVDTDDPTEVARIRDTADKTKNEGRDIIIPKGATEVDAISIPQYSTLDPLNWRREKIQSIVKSMGVPELIMGGASNLTESGAKMIYLSWQQPIEKHQRYLEAQCKMQLNVELKFEFPARIEENLGEDEGKDSQINRTKRSEVTVVRKGLTKGTGDPAKV